MTRDYRLISADGHVSEPPDLWISEAPAEYHERVPHVEHRDDGDYWVVPGSRWGSMPLKRMEPSSYDPHARIEALDADGVDAEVLFPNSGPDFASAAKDPEFHLAMIRIYNDWI